MGLQDLFQHSLLSRLKHKLGGHTQLVFLDSERSYSFLPGAFPSPWPFSGVSALGMGSGRYRKEDKMEMGRPGEDLA